MAVEMIEDKGIGRPVNNDWMDNFGGFFKVIAPDLEFRPYEDVGLVYVSATELIAGNFEEPTPEDVLDAVDYLIYEREKLVERAARQCGTAISGKLKHVRVDEEPKGMIRIDIHDWKDRDYPEGFTILGETNAVRGEWYMEPRPGRKNGGKSKYSLHIGEVIGDQNLMTQKRMNRLTDRINSHVVFDPIGIVRSVRRADGQPIS